MLLCELLHTGHILFSLYVQVGPSNIHLASCSAASIYEVHQILSFACSVPGSRDACVTQMAYGPVTTLYGHHTRNISFLTVPENLHGAQGFLSRALLPAFDHILEEARKAQVIPEKLHATIQVLYLAFAKCPFQCCVWPQLLSCYMIVTTHLHRAFICCELHVLCVLVCMLCIVAVVA